MARYKVILAYDGTHFAGFQRQAEQRSVQQVVETALASLGWQGNSLLAAGRTDQGVHASGQVIAFDLNWRHSQAELQRALNARLPEDVAAVEVQHTWDGFHPRYQATARTYRYHIFCAEFRQPLLERYAWRVHPPADLERMNQACRALPGVHDFAAFGAPHKPGGSTTRQIFWAEWQPEGAGLVFSICGNAFLYHMVRHITARLVEIGQGKAPLEALEVHLADPHGSPVQALAPACGLVLSAVAYAGRDEAPGEED